MQLSSQGMSTRNELAIVPPMGWNSYTCYGITVREEEVKANASYMAEHLAQHGWQYVVVDGMWYQDTGPKQGEEPWEPTFIQTQQYSEERAQYPEPRIEPLPLRFDSYGRLLPDLHKFPSSTDEAGFRPLADYIHSLDLKFGIHIMRGIPQQVVEADYPVLDTTYTAREIGDTSDVCEWWQGMYGMKMDHPGAQAYYDSIVALYASWGVDFIKADDLGIPRYQKAHVDTLSRAIAKCDREIVLSISTGSAADTSFAEHRKKHSQMWRIGSDVHDEWSQIRETFEFLPRWQVHSGPGHWPDPDMLPLGKIHIRQCAASVGHPHMTKLSKDEQLTTMTLWCISRSPLMFAGDLPSNDDWTLQLISNPEVLAVNQRSSENRETFRMDDTRVWDATAEDGQSRYVACFHLGETPSSTVDLPFAELCLPASCTVRDLWKREDLGTFTESFSADLPQHGARLLKMTPAETGQ